MGRHSIKARIAPGIAAMLFIMTVALAANTVQASRAIREQAVSSYRTTGAAIMEQIDFQLEGADAHLHALAGAGHRRQLSAGHQAVRHALSGRVGERGHHIRLPGGGSDERPTFSLVSDAGALMAGGGSSVLPPGLDYTGR